MDPDAGNTLGSKKLDGDETLELKVVVEGEGVGLGTSEVGHIRIFATGAGKQEVDRTLLGAAQSAVRPGYQSRRKLVVVSAGERPGERYERAGIGSASR